MGRTACAAKKPSTLHFGRVSGAVLSFNLLIAQGATHRIPHNGNHADHGREHASRHGEDDLRVPSVILQVRSQFQAGQIRRRRMTGCVARRWQILREALLRKCCGRR